MRVLPVAVVLSSSLVWACAHRGPSDESSAGLEDIPLYFSPGGSFTSSRPVCKWASLGLIEVKIDGHVSQRKTRRILQAAAQSRRAQGIIELRREGYIWMGEVIGFTDPNCMR